MADDSAKASDARAWLEKAIMDLRGARIDMQASPPLPEDALFHCQQAVEKSLKAFLVWHDRPFRKTHSIEEIGEACLEIDETLAELVDQAVPLTEFAWAYRYPGDPEEPVVDEVEDAIILAGKVFDAIVGRVPESARPHI